MCLISSWGQRPGTALQRTEEEEEEEEWYVGMEDAAVETLKRINHPSRIGALNMFTLLSSVCDVQHVPRGIFCEFCV